MFTTIALLDRAKKVHADERGDASDYRLAQLLGVSPQHISNYRTGRTRPDNVMAARLARLCGLNQIEVVVDVNNERYTEGEEADFWRELRQMLRRDPDAELLASVPKIPRPTPRKSQDR